ncbi:type 4a pilus biogenesis protein PilO [Vreelandella alkaliphila]|uniref:Type 4a pilus biogenesis protein PilO n=1 Tax=Vreelandella alkaliphila TaxID=272774 RepID=A0A7C9K4M8_9GAMM|nr:type 4a pilus biogenesis protein PilO [Halomonas alkaliphila]NDL70282.1 type 4a pilus biogenesis protein PilO [Halomonas alkaliphila]
MMLNRQRFKEEWQRLQNVDWQSLDIKQAGEWPWLLKALIALLAFLVALAAINWWLVGEARDLLAAEQRQEERLLDEYRRSASEAALLTDIRSQLSMLEDQMMQMQAMLPTNAEIPSLLDSISEAATEHRLIIESIRLRPTISNTYYIEHPFDIQVRGGYHALGQFAADISDLPRIVTQHDVTLSPIDQYGDKLHSGKLRMSLLARTYSDKTTSVAEGGSP